MTQEATPSRDKGSSEPLTAGFLLGFYFWLITWYRNRFLATEGLSDGTPSTLILLWDGTLSESFAFLNYLHHKALLFSWMMLCLLSIGLLYFKVDQRWPKLCLGAVWLQVASLVVLEQRLWTGSTLILLFLSAVFLAGGCRAISFLGGLIALSALFSGQMLAWSFLLSWKFFGFAVPALVLGVFWWRAGVLRATSLCCGIYGWLSFQEHWFFLALLVYAYEQTQAPETVVMNKQWSVTAALALTFFNCAVTMWAWPSPPLGQQWLRHRTPVVVRSDWVFSRGTERETLLILSTLDERGRVVSTDIRQPDADKRVTKTLRFEETVLFSRSWYQKSHADLLTSPAFYSALRNKAEVSAPDWEISLTVSLEFDGGVEKLWLLP